MRVSAPTSVLITECYRLFQNGTSLSSASSVGRLAAGSVVASRVSAPEGSAVASERGVGSVCGGAHPLAWTIAASCGDALRADPFPLAAPFSEEAIVCDCDCVPVCLAIAWEAKRFSLSFPRLMRPPLRPAIARFSLRLLAFSNSLSIRLCFQPGRNSLAIAWLLLRHWSRFSREMQAIA